MSEQLTQAEIDALLNGPTERPALTQEEIDIIGEVGNISMSQAATTLSSLLNHEVKITTPKVVQSSLKEMLEVSNFPKVVTSIEFKAGLDGSNMLMIDVPDAIIIADLMMGNDGKNVADKEFGELELSAVGEAMNQMIGTASTAMATMLGRTIDIFPPQVETLDRDDDNSKTDPNDETPIVAISFELQVEGLIKSSISQLFTEDTVREINDIMLNDKAEVLEDRIVEEDVSEPVQAKEEPKVFVQKADFQELENNDKKVVTRNLDLIMDVPLELTVELGKSRKTIKEILSLGTGSVVELDKMTDEPLEILVNGKLVAEGEVVVINESFGIRITNILSKEERIKNMNA